MKKFDKVWIGAILGIVVPLIAFVIFYFVRYSDLSLGEFLKVYKNLGILTHILSLSVLPDLLVFFGFIQMNYLKGARGVLLATFLFAFTVLIVRFV